MKRSLPIVLCAALGATLAERAPAQSDVLKPFRPGNNPPKEEPARPPKEEATRPPRETPARRPKEEPPKAPPKDLLKDEPAAPPKDETPAPPPRDAGPGEPEAVRPPIVKPDPARPAPAPAEPGEPAAVRPKVIPATPKTPEGDPAPAPVRPAREPAAEIEPGDIVVRPNATPSSPDQMQLQIAEGFYKRKMWRDAAPEFERYVERFPKAPPEERQIAMYHLGECYLQMGALNNARANYEAILANYSGGEAVGYAASRLAKILYDEKDYRAALPIYRKASVRLKQPTLINNAKFFIGRCLEAINQKTEAKVQYEDLAGITESNPYRDASRLSVGRLLEDAGQREGAVKWLLPLGKESQNAQIKAEALSRAGLLQVELGQYDAAGETLKAALELPDAAAWKDRIVFTQFRMLSLRKDYKGLLAEHEKGAANAFNIENKLNALVLVAEAHRELGQRDAAMAIYDQIVREFPATTQSRDASYARLVMLYDTSDARLLEEVNRFLTDNPTAPQVERVSLMKAEALFKTGDFEHAAPIYEVILEKARGLAGDFRGEAAFKLGWCYMQQRQYDRAIAVFGRFLKDHPTHVKIPMALAQRGAAHMQLKQYTAAQKDFLELTTRHPKAREREFGLEKLALVYSQLGDQARMSTAFETLLRDFPDTKAAPSANFWIGCAAFDGKDYKKSIEPLQKARAADMAQYFERATLRLLAAMYNLENLEGTEKEIQFYRDNGGKAEIQSDVIRWLGQEYYKRGDYAKAEKFFPELIIRKEAIDEDKLFLARARVKLGKFKDAVDSYDTYLATVKEPSLRVGALLEKTDAQISQRSWDGAEATVKEGLAVAVEGRYNGEMRLRAGEIEAGRGNFRKALQIFETIPITLDDEDVCPRAIERAITIHRQLGNEEAAKKLENQLRTKYPEYLHRKRSSKPLATGS